MKARVTITPKRAVLDPQGKAIEHALSGLGFSGVHGARVGKLIELEGVGHSIPVEAPEETATALLPFLKAKILVRRCKIFRCVVRTNKLDASSPTHLSATRHPRPPTLISVGQEEWDNHRPKAKWLVAPIPPH